jgi:uncharacterized protein
MSLTKTERWILTNQYKILERLDPDNAEEYRTMQEVLERGYEQEYEWKTPYLYDGDSVMTEEKCLYVVNVLAMYDALQQSYQGLGNKGDIEERDVVFPGFDGNNEATYQGYAQFLRNRSSKFTDLRVRDKNLNSHMPTLQMYNRMQDVWAQLGEGHELSADQIRAILDARIHPDNR